MRAIALGMVRRSLLRMCVLASCLRLRLRLSGLSIGILLPRTNALFHVLVLLHDSLIFPLHIPCFLRYILVLSRQFLMLVCEQTEVLLQCCKVVEVCMVAIQRGRHILARSLNLSSEPFVFLGEPCDLLYFLVQMIEQDLLALFLCVVVSSSTRNREIWRHTFFELFLIGLFPWRVVSSCRRVTGYIYPLFFHFSSKPGAMTSSKLRAQSALCCSTQAVISAMSHGIDITEY